MRNTRIGQLVRATQQYNVSEGNGVSLIRGEIYRVTGSNNRGTLFSLRTLDGRTVGRDNWTNTVAFPSTFFEHLSSEE